jgi:hypothetical protein
MPAVGGDGHPRAQLARRSVVADAHAPDGGRAFSAIDVTDNRLAHDDAWFKLTPGVDGLLQQQPIEIAPEDGAAVEPAGISPPDRGAAFASDEHPVDAQSARVDAIGDAEVPQSRERARIDRIAAQFVARKVGAIDETHARARACQHHAGDRAGRPRANDQYIEHWVIG